MKKVTLLLLACLLLNTAFSQAASKTDQIKQLLELTGSGKLGIQVAEAMIGSFKQSYSTVPEEFWTAFSKELNADTLIAMIIPIYDRHYSAAELSQLIDFYQTPLGKKVVAATPLIMQESMQAGQSWGREIGEKVYEQLRKGGYIKE